MALSRKDYEFNNQRICHIMPKHIELDRVMINLYMLLKYDGRRPVAKTGRKEVTIDYIVKELIEQNGDVLIGFRDYPDVVRDWVYSDLVDVVYRGVPDREAIAAPMPFHLNAYKLRNPRLALDYGASEHLFSMIRYAEPELIQRLAEFLGRGMDRASFETYDGQTPLDLETLLVVRMVENPNLNDGASSRGEVPEPPMCLGQARLLCNDLRRLLAYEQAVPRSVLIGYLRSAFGLHLGLYLLRLFCQLRGWVQDKRAHPACLNCPVKAENEYPFADCPYAFQNQQADTNIIMRQLLVDMGEDRDTHMAHLSRVNCARHYATMNGYVQSVFCVNQIFQFANSAAGRRQLPIQPKMVADVLAILAKLPADFGSYFDMRLDGIISHDKGEEERAEVRAIWNMTDLSSLDRFIELVSVERMHYYRKYLTEQIDSVLMKNRDTCLLQQGQGRGERNERRWHVGSHLLELLVQLAVLEPHSGHNAKVFCSRPILIDEFVLWLRERYGLVLMPHSSQASIGDNAAFISNLQHLKRQLREIGFYTDLSDAYNAQTIRPRYPIEAEAQETTER